MALFKKRFKAANLVSLDEFENLMEEGRPVFVDFYQFGCQPCQVMDGIVNEVAEQFAESASVVKANVDNVPDLFYRFTVKSTPTFMIFVPKNGQVHQSWRQSGLVKKDLITSQLAAAVSATI